MTTRTVGPRWRRGIPTAIAAALLAASCSLDTAGSVTQSTPAGTTVTVLAAASLTDALTEIARQVEAENPGVRVTTSYAGSTAIVQQVAAGAPADVVVLAGTDTVRQLPPDTPGRDTAQPIATTRLEVAVSPARSDRITGLADLARPDIAVVLCAAQVPCGKAADTVLRRAGIQPRVVSREADVRATLAKVTLGEADAALVYHSDVVAAGSRVTGVAIDPAVNEPVRYPLLVLRPDRPEAVRFATAVRSQQARDTLTRYGFDTP